MTSNSKSVHFNTDITNDAIFNGKIGIYQYRHGYRFSIDAIILAHFPCLRPKDVILDLGTGCGVIPLILTFRCPDIQVVGVEVQKSLASLAHDNICRNGKEDQISILHEDLKKIELSQLPLPPTVVICNPPYRKAKSGRINPDPQKAIARHEIKATLADIVTTASRVLSIGGRFYLIYPAWRLVDALTQMRKKQLEPKRLRLIHSRQDSEATLVLVEGVKAGRSGLKIARPLVIYQADGHYTDEVAAIISGTVKTCH